MQVQTTDSKASVSVFGGLGQERLGNATARGHGLDCAATHGADGHGCCVNVNVIVDAAQNPPPPPHSLNDPLLHSWIKRRADC